MLLATLKERKKVTLFDNIKQNKRPRLQSTSDYMDNHSTSNTAPSSLAVLDEVTQSHSSQSSLPDLIGEQNGGADCPCEDDEKNTTIRR